MNAEAKICPLMSNPDKKVYCTPDCQLYKDKPQFHDCAFNRIIEAIENVSEIIFNKPDNN